MRSGVAHALKGTTCGRPCPIEFAEVPRPRRRDRRCRAPSFPSVPGTYDPHTALVVVDVQNDFADPDGQPLRAGGRRVIEAVNAEAEAAHRAGALVVTTQDWHPADTPHFAKDGGTWPVHCVAGTWGAEPAPRPGGGRPPGARGRRRRGRLLGVLDGAPRDRRDRHRPGRTAAQAASSGWSSSAWPPTTASRRPRSTRCASASPRPWCRTASGRSSSSRATGSRRLDAMADAGVALG